MGRRVSGGSPFAGDVEPWRVSLLAPGSGRPTVPFPHPWNYGEPIRILETYHWGSAARPAAQRHTSYLDVQPFDPVLVTRDPGLIKAILKDTGAGEGEFDRDTLPSTGIARATGTDTLLYANGETWRRQKKLSALPFSKSKLFQPEKFHEFEQTFRQTVTKRLDALREHLAASGQDRVQVELEPEIKVVMLEMLANNFFGAEIDYDELRDRFVPALMLVIEHIVADTVVNKLGLSFPSRRVAQAKADFEELVDRVLEPRRQARGLWGQFRSDAPDDALRSNLRVFLAGALEATTSFASWALSHLARDPELQQRVYDEVKDVDTYTPQELEDADLLGLVLEETLRLTPSLYFLPRRATTDRWVETEDGRRLMVPRGTHVLLDVWHANRCEDFWGVPVSGIRATAFDPGRWEALRKRGISPKNLPHFGFGLGPRVCPGKHLGQLEVGLVVGATIRVFKLSAVNPDPGVHAAVSTKPADGVLVDLELRE